MAWSWGVVEHNLAGQLLKLQAQRESTETETKGRAAHASRRLHDLFDHDLFDHRKSMLFTDGAP
ncbi:MAG: hypothetical protein WC076_00795 [Terrimicrobiaceae bacterium]|nr:hypothetical protein [Terrimicrobiaceae bacterium]